MTQNRRPPRKPTHGRPDRGRSQRQDRSRRGQPDRAPRDRSDGDDQQRRARGRRPQQRRSDARQPPDKPVDEVASRAARRTDWGGVARKGASVLRPIPGADRGDAYAAKVPERQSPRPQQPAPPERAKRAPQDAPRRSRSKVRLEVPQLDPIGVRGMPSAEQQRLSQRLREAGEDFLAERFGDALTTLRPLASRYAAVAEVQELYGLTLYRLGRWTAASHRLEQYEQLTGAVDQLPVLADCYRALGRLNEVHDVWDRLRHADPDAQTITEGRIVAAGALADEGRPRDAIRLLEAGPLRPKRPKEHHLRLWYALADLYDRVGDLQRARRGFARIAEVDPGFVDVEDRLAALGNHDT